MLFTTSDVHVGSYYIGRSKRSRGLSTRIVVDYDTKRQMIHYRDLTYRTALPVGPVQKTRFNKFKKWVRGQVIPLLPANHSVYETDVRWRWTEEFHGAYAPFNSPSRFDEITREIDRERDAINEDDFHVNQGGAWEAWGIPNTSGYVPRNPTLEIDKATLLEDPVVAFWDAHVVITQSSYATYPGPSSGGYASWQSSHGRYPQGDHDHGYLGDHGHEWRGGY